MRYLHTSLRVHDLDAELGFFRGSLDMVEIHRLESTEHRFTLVMLAAPQDQGQAAATCPPCVELTFDWDASPPDTRGFGHLAYRVDDIYALCARLRDQGVTINRPPRDGRMAFIRSPGGTSIELLQSGAPLPPREPWASMEDDGAW
ncbi:MAG: VOC family protein [Pseudolabrys sp.]